MPYRIRFSPESQVHLSALTARDKGIIAHAIDSQLRHQPTVETRNRKRLRPNELAQWELRVGEFRVYFRVADEPEPTVIIRAIGVKIRNQVFIAGEEYEL